MRNLLRPSAILFGCLLAPTLSVFTYIATGDFLYSSLSLICITLVTLAVLRYSGIDPTQGKLLAVTKVFAVGIFCATSVILTQSSVLWKLVANFLQSFFPQIQIPDATGHEFAAILIAVFIILATVAISWIIVGVSTGPSGVDRDFTGLSLRQLDVIESTLKDTLDSLDEELRFFDFQSGNIDPKLEELNTSSRYVKIRSAIQVAAGASSRDFIVVKGEPGSGKSVMVRGLARQLLLNIKSGGKVPLLLNLRDWDLKPSDGPQEISNSLHKWVRGEYRRQTGMRDEAVTADEFEQLYAEGAIIFLFDSFDENLAVSGSSHLGAFVAKLSKILVEYVRGSGGCVALIFSREYKSPSAGWLSHRTYGVRPFSDKDIKKYISQNCTTDEPLIKAIMGERRDLYVMAKSPLLLALLVDYSNNNYGYLPNSEFVVFESFIQQRIGRAVASFGFPADSVREAEKAGKLLARRHSGVTSGSSPGGLGLSILQRAGLLKRTGARDSFSHKRFQEYFRVCNMMSGSEAPPSISPNEIDKNRDVLNLFAQVCSLKRAKKLARDAHRNLCDSFEAFEGGEAASDYVATILSLRFLRNAFRNRPKVLDRYRHSIREIVVSLWNRMDVLNQKHAVEHLALLPPDTATSFVRISLRGSSGLLRRVALAEARYVSSLQPWLGRCVAAHFSKQDDFIYLNSYSRGEIGPTLTNAAIDDRLSMTFDAVIRVALLAMFFASLFVDDTILVRGFALIVLVAYLILNSGRSGEAADDDLIAKVGFNAGLSGLIAFNIFVAAGFNTIEGIFNPAKQFFWTKAEPFWLSSLILVAACAMVLNNLLVRRRDALDELGEVGVLSRAVLKVNPVSGSATLAFFERHALILCLFAVLLIGRVGDVTWALVVVLVAFCAITLSTLVFSTLVSLRNSIARRLDRPKGLCSAMKLGDLVS